MEDFPDIKDFGALADAAAAERLSSQRGLSAVALDAPMHMHHGPAPQTTGSASQSMSQSQTPSSAAQNPGEEDEEEEDDEEPDDGPPPAPIGSDITAWQTAIQTLPADFKNQPRFQHPLASMLSDQKTIRQIEWNPNRQNGGFVPRTPNDFSSMMIFICGQINPNPCRNCRLKNGPFARCIVAPPEILAVSTIRHACANCCYQNQHRESGRQSRRSRNGVPKVRKPKSHIPKNKPPSAPMPPYGSQMPYDQYQAPQHASYAQASIPTQPMPLPALGKPSSESGSVKSFADKVRMARAWNQQSRRRMKAELLQWQAALATADAERPRKTTRTPVAPQQQHQPPPPLPPPQQTQQTQHQNVARPPPPATPSYIHHTMPPSSYSQSTPSASYPQSAPSSSYPQHAPSLPNGRAPAPAFQPLGDVNMGGQEDDSSDVTNSEDEEAGGGGEDHTWAGFDDEEDRVMIKPPIP
ncbi:hypothetical protein PG994_002978 [Apiospora phragmitis]|uniref:Uncharacterized protein n=1 Tax=Apiospora phragmitis TaxID=2905665 RepID=A0ABR1W6R4_9PEZI